LINIAVFISGRGSNFLALLKNIEKGVLKNCRIAVVFSNNPNAKGLEYAAKAGIKTIVIPSKNRSDRVEYDKEIINALSEYNVDLICLAGYMRIVTEELVEAYKNKIINIHPALLPSFPGLHAQKQALDYGVKVSGCTVHFVDGGMDTGPIILQKTVPVYDNDTEDTLSARILEQEHTAYSEAVALYAAGRLKVSGRKVEILDK
jgi:phosphoribosylglycinamide formyltransferase-1